MMKKSRKFNSIEEVEKYAQNFVGQKLKSFLDLSTLNSKNKGNLGNLIQEQVFEIPVNNKAEPDFVGSNLKLELKITPVKNWRAKTNIPPKNV